MKTYARIENGVVAEIILPHPEGWPIEDRFTAEFVATLVDVTGLKPMPSEAWVYDGEKFSLPPAPEPFQIEPAADPVDKLKAFLLANPDVAQILK
jgi:hypothetical protein